MNATITFYVIDLSKPEGNVIKSLVREKMKEVGFKRFEYAVNLNGPAQRSIRDELDKLKSGGKINLISDPIPINLELEHVFADQWNEETYGRIFDWCEHTFTNKQFVEGYFLDFTLEVADTRCVKKCGYCGKSKTAENSSDWIEDYHLNCPIEYLEEQWLFLTKATEIWKDKASLNKNNPIPKDVKHNFYERKCYFIEKKYEEKLKNDIDLANTAFEKALVSRRIRKKIFTLLYRVAVSNHIFITPYEVIVYDHSPNEYEINICWSGSGKQLTESEIFAIRSHICTHPEYDADNGYFLFKPQVCNKPVRITFNKR